MSVGTTCVVKLIATGVAVFLLHRHTVPQLAAFGSYHGMELFYVFNTWENATLGRSALFSSQDAAVQNAMLRYWVNFAATGNLKAQVLLNGGNSRLCAIVTWK